MQPPPVLTREQVRRVDALAIERFGMSGLVLMENAGRGAVDALRAFDPSLFGSAQGDEQQFPIAGLPRGPGGVPEGVALRLGGGSACDRQANVVVLCGKGNNAGDGFVIARHLEIRGVAVKTLLLGTPAELAGDARCNYEILLRCGGLIVDLSTNRGAELTSLLDRHAAGADWLVDALLGTGAVGQPREPFATVIGWMNAQSARRLAIDLPSGLDCDTGEAAAATVRADLTATFVAAKPGLLVEHGRRYAGEVRVVDIGVPWRAVRQAIDR